MAAKAGAKVSAIKQAYRDAFGSPQGHTVLVDLCKRAFQLKTVHIEMDPQILAGKAGERAVVLHILRQLSTSDAELLGLMEEGIMHKVTET